MKVAFLTTDSRELLKDYAGISPVFGTAPEAVLQGFALLPGVEAHVICCTRAPLKTAEKLAPNIHYHSLVVPKIGWMTTAYQGCIRAIRRKLRQIQPDIVHGQGSERECAMSAVFSGFPNVLTIHGNMAHMARVFHYRIGSFGWLAGQLEDFALKRTAGVFCNSAHTEQLVQPRARKTWRVPNPVRLEFFAAPAASKSRGKCCLVNIGVVSAGKRQLELLNVAEELHRRNLDFEFRFVGGAHQGSSYVKQFFDKIKPMEAAGYARFVGGKALKDLLPILDESHGMAHFPVEESFGLVVAEALARNLKFFGARTGGIPDITAGVVDAELFPTGDWRSMVPAIADWIQKGAPVSQNGARLMRERYHPEAIARRHLEIYREVLGRAA